MRNLSALAASVFSQSGIEPVILVRIYWNNGEGITYSDRRFEGYGFNGKLISVGELDDVVNIDNTSSTAQVSVVLDDTDSSIKQIFNQTDIHKTKVQLLQWSTDLPPSDAFVIFTGQISSPIEWKESDYTLSFEVVTKIEDRQVGFSVEQGNFNAFPSKLIGKAWPIVFGTVGGVKPLQILEAPTGIVGEGFSIVDDNVWQLEIDELNEARVEALNNARDAYLAGVAEAFIASRYKGQFLDFLEDDPSAASQHDQAADSLFAQSAQYTEDARNIDLQIIAKQEEWDEQKAYDKQSFRVLSQSIPSGVPLQFMIGDCELFGTYQQGMFFTTDRKFPEDYGRRSHINQVQQNRAELSNTRTLETYGDEREQVRFGQKFQWVDGGTEIRVTNFPLTFVVSVMPVAVTAVWGYRRNVRTIVPTNYYTVEYRPMGNSIVTLITLTQPLTSRTFFNGINRVHEGWENDEIEVDCVSSIGPNTIDIMVWAISLYTDFGIDAASFNAVKSLVNPFPMNFALTERKNVVQFLQELAHQATCSIWLNDDTFFIRFLPLPPTPIDTFTDDDVVLNTLSITCNPTEEIVTSYVATWKPNSFQDDFKIIYQYNIPRYGFHEETYNYYAYNIEELVKISAQYWMIRKANTFKIIKFKTALHKIKIETFDAITLDFEPGLIANGPVVGTVLKATYDTKDKLIDMEVWIPVRFGEMDVYAFAEPYFVQSVYPLPNDPNIQTENPFELAGLFPQEEFLTEQHFPFQHHLPSNIPPRYGRGEVTYYPGLNAQIPTITNYGPVGGTYVPPANIGANVILEARPTTTALRGSNNYTRQIVQPITVPTVTEPKPGSFPGTVVALFDPSNFSYVVDVYFKGLSNPPTRQNVRQFMQEADDEIAAGTPVIVHRLVYVNDDGGATAELWMQAPTWLIPKVTT